MTTNEKEEKSMIEARIFALEMEKKLEEEKFQKLIDDYKKLLEKLNSQK